MWSHRDCTSFESETQVHDKSTQNSSTCCACRSHQHPSLKKEKYWCSRNLLDTLVKVRNIRLLKRKMSNQKTILVVKVILWVYVIVIYIMLEDYEKRENQCNVLQSPLSSYCDQIGKTGFLYFKPSKKLKSKWKISTDCWIVCNDFEVTFNMN